MANEIQCGNCVHYHPLQKPLPSGGFKKTGYGHCLDRTVYAQNRPGKTTYPPRCKTAELPFGRHQIALVKETETIQQCAKAKMR